MRRLLPAAVLAVLLAAGGAYWFMARHAPATAPNAPSNDLEARAEAGEAAAQIELGNLAERRARAETDPEVSARSFRESLEWYRKAAAQGDAETQFMVGLIYGAGNGVPKDNAAAAEWFRKAADQGHALAQLTLGEMYDMGLGVPQDWPEAARWYRKAAEQGARAAQARLGKLYYWGGLGVPQDWPEAARWYRKAAEQGARDAQASLAEMYDIGEGVPQDHAEAYFWFHLAAAPNTDAPNKSYAACRDGAAARLTPDVLAATQKRCREWMEAFAARREAK